MLFRNPPRRFLDLSRVTYETTSRCSRGCLYCYNYWRRPDEKEAPFDASYADSLKTLKRLFQIYPVKHVTFTGGEPLLAERLPELILYAKRKRAYVNLITGGGVPLSFYERLFHVPPDQVQIPFHSIDPEIHDAMMGSDGAHAAALESLALFEKHGVGRVAVLILTRMNLETLNDTLQEMKRLKIGTLLVNRFDPGGRGLSHIDELELNPDELNRAFTLLNEVSSPDFTIYSGVNTPHCLLDRRNYPRIGFGGCKVHLGEGPITVDVAGNLRLCNQSQYIVGNIHTQSLAEMVSHPVVAQWKTAVPEGCGGCSRFDECQSGCRAAGEQMGLSAAEPDPYLIRFKSFQKIPENRIP